jgi:hypothetical protein
MNEEEEPMQRRTILRQAMALSLVVGLLVSQAWGATSLQYTLPGSAVVFADSGGTVAITFSNRATANGNVSAQYDKNVLASPTGAMPSLWAAHCQISLTGTNAVGTTIEYYIAHADAAGTTTDAGVGQAATTITVDQRRALTPIGVLVVYQTTTNTTMYASFRNIYIPGRYYSLAWWNASGLPTETSTTKHKCTFYPMPPQMQAS